MWQEISSISGLPFPRSPSLIDNNNDALYNNSVIGSSRLQSATTYLSTDNVSRSTTRSVAQLQSDLLRSTNHAIASGNSALVLFYVVVSCVQYHALVI